MNTVISTPNAPAAIGPYSQAVRVGDLLYTSGQIPLDPATGAMPAGIELQTRQALSNVKAVVEAAGSTMANVVKTTVFLTDMGNFAAMNGVYAEFFKEGSFPARSAVQVGALPKGALVEIEAVASL